MNPPENRFTAWEFVGPVFLKALEREGQSPDTIGGTQLVAVLTVGICPAALAESINSTETRELALVFAGFYATHPELILRLLGVARKTWNDKSVTAKVQKHHLTRRFPCPVPCGYKTILGTPFFGPGPISDAEMHELILGPKPKSKVTKSPRPYAVKTARKRIQRPVWRPIISKALGMALLELRRRHFEVGVGW
ncbi:MAG: hypothetical protein NT154_08980 [Verrucomicrobia bacterium]|nr:hypothetical protein [Verrucomicrobiota bacterium]